METQSLPVLIPLPPWSCTGTVVSSFWTTLEVRIRFSISLTIGSSSSAIDGHPVAHRRARQLDAGPLEDPFEAIERQVIGIFADRDVSQQPRAGQALVDRLGEPLGDHDVGLAGLAGILGADVFEHDQGRGDVFELLADFLADAGPLGAAVGAGALFGRDVVQDRLAGQARRQRLAAVAILLGRTGSGRRGRGRLRGRAGVGAGSACARISWAKSKS